jgi:cytochrome P450
VVVTKGLTAWSLGGLVAELRWLARPLVAAAVERGTCDLVEAVAGELPMQAICILLGVPEVDRHQVFEWIEYSFDFRDREAFETTDDVAVAQAALFEYGTRLIASKRAAPGDDMLSIVTHASLPEEDPPQLREEELQMFFSLLFAAGADTTRNAIAGGVLALAHHPDEFHALRDDRTLMPTAIEEIVRWTHPASYNRRTATRDVELRGQPVRAGDKVVFWEASANRDEDVFVDPFRFDVRRDPNPHLGFGRGTHHCLGASLARLEIRVVLDELLDATEALDIAGPVQWARTNKHTGIRALPVHCTPRASARRF